MTTRYPLKTRTPEERRAYFREAKRRHRARMPALRGKP